jgi:hypothetical protein
LGKGEDDRLNSMEEKLIKKDLLGNEIEEEISVRIFCDESGTSEWLYIGLLLVPEKEERLLLDNLYKARCKNWLSCFGRNNCKYHDKNDKEIHFAKIGKDRDRFYVSKRWAEYFASDRERTRFYILGIDKTKLKFDLFGSKNSESINIYNRFFRSALEYSLKKFFGQYKRIKILEIYHDYDTAKEMHEYFPWHCIKVLNDKQNNLIFITDKIKFIDSKHSVSKNEYSHLIQYIDLITGCVKEIFEAESNSKTESKTIITKIVLDLIRRIVLKPKNKNSSFKYFNRCAISFFPKTNYDKAEEIYGDMKKFIKNFYTYREIKIDQKNINQMEIEFPKG